MYEKSFNLNKAKKDSNFKRRLIEEIKGRTTTEIEDVLRSKLNNLQSTILSRLNNDDLAALREKGIIDENGNVLKSEDFDKFVKGKLP
ncbi:hypothetical protein [Saccharolobus islandicus]|uniref:Uncharacterized protein n=1 Tax=Saccharolobus islandicus (strain REY15A) TaxID=930945 RepID=F0NIR5_SACI5|nr:hypothetical protein [Sulfolobus islandicus]ADX85996.1 hypothetical protein SiRe_1936 [Sulfolobus islandicus REY15A]